MHRRYSIAIVSLFSVILVLTATASARGPQQKATAISVKPERDPNQPIDEEYTKIIRQNLQETSV